MSGTAAYDTLAKRLSQSDPSQWGQQCIAELERWVPAHVERGRLAALVLWIGWRGITNMARTCKKFRHWLEWSCLRCGLDYRLVHRKWYTGLQTWCYNERVIAASLCTTCHEQEMQRMEAGNCRFCHVYVLQVHFHERHVCADRWGIGPKRLPPLHWSRTVLDIGHKARDGLEVPDTPGAASSVRPTHADSVLSQCSCCRGHKQCGVWFMKGYHPDEGAQPADKCLECRRDVPGGSCGCFCWDCNSISWTTAFAGPRRSRPPTAFAHGSELPLPGDAQVVDLTNTSDRCESPWLPALAEAAATASPPTPPLPPAIILPRRPRPYPWTRPMAPATRRSTNTRANPYDGRTGPRPPAARPLSDTS